MCSVLLDVLGRSLSCRSYLHPVFIVGPGRAGTSVLKRALGRHSAVIACDGESPAVAELASALSLFRWGDDAAYFKASLKLPMETLENRLRRLCTEAAIGSHFGARLFLREVVRSRKRPDRIGRWCAKTFPTREAADCLLSLYPGARFVYIIRNGVDVVFSRTRFPPMQHLPFEEQCKIWSRSVEKYRYLSRCPQAHVVRHEELVEDPDHILAGVLSFLELPVEQAPSRLIRSTLVHSLSDETRGGVDARLILRERRSGFEEWSADERLIFKRVCSEAMDELGYEIPF